MKIDRRLIDIDLAEHEEPVDKLAEQLGALADNLMAGYLKNPARTDAILRRDGMTRTADRLVELFGPGWWEKQGTTP